MEESDGEKLVKAVSAGNFEKTAFLIKAGASVQWKDENGCDALYAAASFRSSGNADAPDKNIYEITKMLINAGSFPGSEYRYLGDMPVVVIAGMNGNTGCIAALMEAGTDINSKDRAGFTALHRAAMNGWYSTVELLLKSGAKKEIQNLYQETALDLAKNAQREDSGAKVINRDFKKTIDLLS